MQINLSKTQCRALIDYIEINLLDVIRRDVEIDNIEWVHSILTARDALKKAVETYDENHI